MSVRLVAMAALVLMLPACRGGSADLTREEDTVVEGTVIAVDGTLAAVASFTLRLPDGRDLVLVPAEGVLFDGSAPIGHLQDHLASGAPVRVGYVVLADGTLSAVLVEDA